MPRQRKLKDFLEASYLPQKQAKEKIKQQYGYEYDPQLSSMTTKVFLSPGTQEAILAHRGSVRLVDDWLNTNLPLAIGQEGKTKRFQQAKSTLDLVKEKYPGYTTTSLGHSLSGAIARASDADKIVSYNPGVGLGQIGKKIGKNETIYRAAGDPVSSLSSLMYGPVTRVNVPSLNPLTIHGVSQMPEDIFF